MSVYFENRRRGSDYETDAPRRESKLSTFFSRGGRPDHRHEDEAPLWGFSYDRAEGVVHLLLAFSVVGGAAAMLSSVVFGVAPAVEKAGTAVIASATPNVAPTQPKMEPTPARPIQKAEAPPPPAPIAPDMRAVAIPPGAMAPAPLVPPTADQRERLGSHEAPAPQETTMDAPPAPAAPQLAQLDEPPAREEAPPAPDKIASAPKDDAREADRGRMAHCYLKLSGRVQTSGSCRVQHTDDSVILQLPGKPLEIAHAHGRVWIATLGGHNLGKVYKSGACWGARGFYACQSG